MKSDKVAKRPRSHRVVSMLSRAAISTKSSIMWDVFRFYDTYICIGGFFLKEFRIKIINWAQIFAFHNYYLKFIYIHDSRLFFLVRSP